MSADILVSLKAAKRKGLYGRKAEHPLFLVDKGHQVPPTYLISYEAREAFLNEGKVVLTQLGQGIGAKLDPRRKYVVRSSAVIARERGVPMVTSVQGATSLEEVVDVHVDDYTDKVSVLAVKGA